MKNNPFPISDDLKKRMVVYHFECPHEGGCPHTYVGMTTMRLSKRISCHGQEGAIFQHFTEKHNRRPTRQELIHSITIVGQADDALRLRYLEALIIKDKKPSLNTTNEIVLLPTLRNRFEIGHNPDTPQGPPAEQHSTTHHPPSGESPPPDELPPVGEPDAPTPRGPYNLRSRRPMPRPPIQQRPISEQVPPMDNRPIR